MSTTPQPPPTMTLALGKEELLADRVVSSVVGAARAVDADTDVRRLEAPGLTPGTVTDLLQPSLFGERKVVVVSGVGDAAEELFTELKAVVADLVPRPHEISEDRAVHVVLLHRGGQRGKALLDAARKAGASVVMCPEVKYDSDKVKFVSGEFRQAHRKITAEGAQALVEALGSDLRELASACSQLVSDTTGTVDPAVVDRYHAGRVETSGFKVADKAVEGRPEEALALLRHALATGVAPVLVTSALAGTLRGLVKTGSVPRSTAPAELARELGMAPWMIEKARRQLKGWTAEGLDRSIRAVAVADAAVKGAGADPAYAVEKVVITVSMAHG